MSKKKINIAHVGNDLWFDWKSDIVFGLLHAFADHQIDVTVSHNTFDNTRLNLLIGADWLSWNQQAVAALQSLEHGYSVFEVEEYCGGHLHRRDGWPADVYNEILRNSEFIATPYVANYREMKDKFQLPRGVQYTQWGFHETFRNPRISRSSAPDQPLLFFGMIKGQREEKIKYLKDTQGLQIEVWDGKGPQELLNYKLCKCLGLLHLNHSSEQQIINPFRLMRAIANGVPVVTVEEEDQDQYASYMYKVDAQTVSQQRIDELLAEADLDELLGRRASLSKNIEKLVALL